MLAVLFLNNIRMQEKNKLTNKSKLIVANNFKNEESDYCRTCLNTCNLVSLFDNKESAEKRSQELLLLTGLEISMNDGLPQKLCKDCVTLLNAFAKFRRICRKTQSLLLSLNHSKKIKKRELTKKKKEEFDTADALDYNYDYGDFQNDYQGDFQNNCQNELQSEVEIKVEVMDYPVENVPTKTKRKRVVLPNAQSYKCPTCGKVFRMKATYRSHMKFHTDFCVCESCGKRCRNNIQLQEHKRARHGLGRIHKCAYCEYSSATKEALTIHERRHTGERPYICDHCQASFHRRSNLVQHLGVHMTDKNFQCDMCPRRFKSRKFLQIHKHSAHTGKRYKYVCGVCEHRFEKPNKVRAHLRRVHALPDHSQPPIKRIQI